MNIRKIASASTLALGLFLGSLPVVSAASPEACRGGEGHAVLGSTPLKVSNTQILKAKRQIGKHVFEVKAGVSLIIPAELGVSTAFVERAVGCELAKGAQGRGVFSVEGVTAKVRPVIGGYAVDVVAPAGKADEVIQLASHHTADRAVAKADSTVR